MRRNSTRNVTAGHAGATLHCARREQARFAPREVALQSIWSLVTRANQYVDQTKPFSLAKDPTQAKRLEEVLYNLVETCRILAVLLWSFLPGTARKVCTQLGLLGAPDKFDTSGWGGLPAGHAIGEPAPLFPRKDA